MIVTSQTYYTCGICGSVFMERKDCEACERRCARMKEHIVYQLTLSLPHKGKLTASLEEDSRLLMDRGRRMRMCPKAEGVGDNYIVKFREAVPSDTTKSLEQIKLEMMQNARKWFSNWTASLDAELKKEDSAAGEKEVKEDR